MTNLNWRYLTKPADNEPPAMYTIYSVSRLHPALEKAFHHLRKKRQQRSDCKSRGTPEKTEDTLTNTRMPMEKPDIPGIPTFTKWCRDKQIIGRTFISQILRNEVSCTNPVRAKWRLPCHLIFWNAVWIPWNPR